MTGPLKELQIRRRVSPDGKSIVIALSLPGDALGGVPIAIDAGKRASSNPFVLSKDWYFSHQVWSARWQRVLLALAQPFAGG